MADLKSIAINFAIIFMLLSAVPNLVVASGLAEDWGVDPALSGSGDVSEANDALADVQPTGGFASTLFQLYSSVTGPVRVVMDLLIGGEMLFISMGIPNWVTTFVFLPKYLIAGGTIIYVLAGRRL